MRQTSLLPAPFDTDVPRRYSLKYLSSRRSRYGVFVLTSICILFIYLHFADSAFPPHAHHHGPAHETWEIVPGHHHSPTAPQHVRPETTPQHNNPVAGPGQGSPTKTEAGLWHTRAEAVKSAFRSSYLAYEQTAFPHDELRPLSGLWQDNLNGWGASMLDSIDTMILMDFDDLVERSVHHVSQLRLGETPMVQFFETVIRYLGGLLSAYALTDNTIYLTHADELGMLLMPIFNTTTGLPSFGLDLTTGTPRMGWMGSSAILSEFTSCQMEFRYLAHLTGRAEYVKAVDHLTTFLTYHTEHGGLFPLHYLIQDGSPTAYQFSVGAQADSAYEYLLKEWLMTGKTERRFLDMYLKSADAIIEHMLYISHTRKLLYVTDVTRPALDPIHDFQHLSCFLAGLFALGSVTIPNVDPRHAWAAEGLAHTCWITYADTATGLGPESVRFDQGGKKWVDELAVWEAQGKKDDVPGVKNATPVEPGGATEYRVADSRYLLRPETIESFYLMWRTTGDSKWRDRGWALFEAIEKYAKVDSAYASVRDVRVAPPKHEDDLPSFFFAETLKYAYLLFNDKELIPLDKWVFNTEAHPIPIFTWSDWEKTHFGIH